jgi:hypothetical protein
VSSTGAWVRARWRNDAPDADIEADKLFELVSESWEMLCLAVNESHDASRVTGPRRVLDPWTSNLRDNAQIPDVHLAACVVPVEAGTTLSILPQICDLVCWLDREAANGHADLHHHISVYK